MAKKNNTIFEIFTESIGLYFSNFDKFVKYMSFPVLGQLAGLIIVFASAYIFSANIPILISKYPNLNNFNAIITLSILITLPGLILLTKAVWEYLVAYGAVNSMLDNMLHSGKVYDFDAHTELIKRRTVSFIVLWFLLGVFTIFALIPLFWIVCGILAVYFILVFQVFTYEPEQSPLGCFNRSMAIIKGHFASTFILAMLVGSITYILIPQIVLKLLGIVHFTDFGVKLILPIASNISIIDLTQYGLKPITEFDLSLFMVQSLIAQILIQYTLPLRTIVWARWYNNLAQKNDNVNISKRKRTTKRKVSSKKPSEKLMEESHRKFSKTKIDRNILRRAMEKDDED